jgi:PTS system nitrogen regulatory IIA component
MRLTDVLKKEYVIPDLKAGDKDAILQEMVMYLSGKEAGLDRDKLFEALLERERLGTTGIGHGVALPHGKLKGFKKIMVCFGRSRKGVDFRSMDKLPVHLFFLIIAPENSAAAHLKLLACLSRLLKNQDFRDRLMRTKTSSDIYRLIVEADNRYGAI